MAKPSCLLLFSVVLLLGLTPCGAWAYGPDVHFNLTYVLCRLAGLEQKDALWIADADQSMDDNSCTTAFEWKSIFRRYPYDLNGRHFHDFSDAGKDTRDSDSDTLLATIRYADKGEAARLAIQVRLDELRARCPASVTDGEDKIIADDIAFGQYLHAEQDWFSHRQFTSEYLNPGGFLPYGPHVGHAPDGDGHSADYVVLRLALARLMAADCSHQICLYAGKPDIPIITVLALVNALAKTYDMTEYKTVKRGVKTYKEAVPISTLPPGADVNLEATKNITIYPPGSQSKINKAIQTALPGSVKGRDALPEYATGYALPYDDKQTTPLDEVKQKVEVALGHIKAYNPYLVIFPLQAQFEDGKASMVDWSFKLQKLDGTEIDDVLLPLSLSAAECVDKKYPLQVDLKASHLEGELTITAQADIDGKAKSNSVTVDLPEIKDYKFQDVLTQAFQNETPKP